MISSDQKRYIRIIFVGCVMSIASSVTLAQTDQWSIATGIDSNSGHYGLAQATQVQAEYLQLRYVHNDWILKASFPYLHISGPSDVRLVSDSNFLLNGTITRPRHIEGFGDVSLAISKSMVTSQRYAWGLDFTAKVKIPTASHQEGLGTGKTDYSLQLDVYSQKNSITYFGTLGYKWIGQPDAVAYRDISFASVGGLYALSNEINMGIAIDYRQSPVSYMLDQTEGMLFVSKKLAKNWHVQTYLYRGFNEASPELGYGLVLGRRF